VTDSENDLVFRLMERTKRFMRAHLWRISTNQIDVMLFETLSLRYVRHEESFDWSFTINRSSQASIMILKTQEGMRPVIIQETGEGILRTIGGTTEELIRWVVLRILHVTQSKSRIPVM
jgi:hypothetical protein